MKNWIYIFIFWALISFSCDPCNECGEPLLYEPTVAVTFINQDSITALDTAKADTSATIQYYESISQALNDKIDSLGDEITRMSDSIQNGNTAYEDSLDLVTEQIENIEIELIPVEARLDELDSIVDVYNDIIKKINSGLLLVDKVSILNNGAELTYQDSMKVYNLPLLIGTPNETQQTSYEISIKEKTFSFTLSYVPYETLNDARVFRIIAKDIVAESYTCDTLIFNCPNDNCISNETNITAIY